MLLESPPAPRDLRRPVQRAPRTPRYATIVVLICFMFAVLFFIVGIIGEYIAVFFEEMKDRPIYIIEDKENFPES